MTLYFIVSVGFLGLTLFFVVGYVHSFIHVLLTLLILGTGDMTLNTMDSTTDFFVVVFLAMPSGLWDFNSLTTWD